MTRPDYSNGEIYRLTGIDGSVYVGHTTAGVAVRFEQHRADAARFAREGGRRCSSVKLFALGEVTFELIEAWPALCRGDLLVREAHWLRRLRYRGVVCVNEVTPA